MAFWRNGIGEAKHLSIEEGTCLDDLLERVTVSQDLGTEKSRVSVLQAFLE
jgi:hypothetical protein